MRYCLSNWSACMETREAASCAFCVIPYCLSSWPACVTTWTATPWAFCRSWYCWSKPCTCFSRPCMATMKSCALACAVPVIWYLALISPALAAAMIAAECVTLAALMKPSPNVAPAAARLVTQFGIDPTPSSWQNALLNTQQFRLSKSYSMPRHSVLILSSRESTSCWDIGVVPIFTDSRYTAPWQLFGGQQKMPVPDSRKP
mmetsp:Transcript_97588/g.304000  ORF Transcript_97588/g.304000 Transcript_97588/m.304000 type:complete len:202 (+) Transcript_97588:264-869(+)